MKIGITGGAGFVGSHLREVFEAAGHDVVVADRFQHGHERVRGIGDYQPINVLDLASVSRWLHRTEPEVVLHLAAVSNTGQAMRNASECWDVNVGGTVNLCEAALEYGVARVMLASSTLVSDCQGAYPMMWPADLLDSVPEGWLADDVVDERSPLDATHRTARHPYVASKIAAEQAIRSFGFAHGLQWTVFRYGIMYGPQMTPGVLAEIFIRKALMGEPLTIEGDGQQWRQYLHVRDLARAHLMAVEAWDETAFETYNLVQHRMVTVADMAEAVCRVVPKTSVTYGPARAADIDVQFCMAAKAKNHFGWEAEISLEDGIAETVEFYKEMTWVGSDGR